MNQKQANEHKNDPRHRPSYGVTEAAQILRVRYTTLYSWLRPVRLLTEDTYQYKSLIERPNGGSMLSFVNLVEGHVIKGLTSKGFKTAKIRAAVEYAQRRENLAHPLVSQHLETAIGSLFIRRNGKYVNISGGGQFEISAFLHSYLERIDYENSQAIRFFPVVGRKQSKNIVVTPEVRFGKPMLVSKGITTHIIAKRAHDGETMKAISESYGLTEAEVGEAVTFEAAA